MFSFCSHAQTGSPAVNASTEQWIEAESSAPDWEIEVDEAIRICGGDVRAALRVTLVANAYLESEVERLTKAISTGFARGHMRSLPQRVKLGSWLSGGQCFRRPD
jgi:hypothetical protein